MHYQTNADSVVMTTPAVFAPPVGGVHGIYSPDYHGTILTNPLVGNARYSRGFNAIDATLALFIT